MTGCGPLPMDDYEREHWDEPSICVADSLRGFARYRAHRDARRTMKPDDRARVEAEVRDKRGCHS